MRRSRHPRRAGEQQVSTCDLALRQLRRLFSKSPFTLAYGRANCAVHAFAKLASAQMQITTGEPRAKRVRIVAMPITMATVKCSERGCAFPAIIGQRCRQHATDMMAERSSIPCVARPVLSGLRFHA